MDELIATFAGFGLLFALFALAVIVFVVVCEWRVLSKAGESGWKCLIPVLSPWTLACVATESSVVRVGTLVANAAAIVGSLLAVVATGIDASVLVGVALILELAGGVAAWAFGVISNYLLGAAFGEDKAMQVVLGAMPFAGHVAIAFDPEIEYDEPVVFE